MLCFDSLVYFSVSIQFGEEAEKTERSTAMEKAQRSKKLE